MVNTALYIHIPFCRRKCHYCSFVSYAGRDAVIPGYIAALKKEISRAARGLSVPTVYLGGGTPSLLAAARFEDILFSIFASAKVDKTAEITIEANPGTIDEDYLKQIKALGINRLSLGVQSLDDAELALMGRIHTAAQAREAVGNARGAGLSNINLDLIYGLPGQTLDGWRQTLNGAIALAPEHLSLYGLTLEDGVPIEKAIRRGDLPEIDPDLAAAQYELAEALLAARGYNHYEISNWARPGHECRHNLTYWHNQPYLGVGVAAHSYLNGWRRANTSDIDEYIGKTNETGWPPLALQETISPETALAETIILGLRLYRGVDMDEVATRFRVDLLEVYHREIKELAGYGLVETDGRRLWLTPRGRLLSNEVFWRFLPEIVAA